jgi:hypothetical protein
MKMTVFWDAVSKKSSDVSDVLTASSIKAVVPESLPLAPLLCPHVKSSPSS